MSSCCPTEVLPNKDASYQYKADNVYIAGAGNTKGLLYIPDIFGPHPNAYQVADILAGRGFLVIMPDFFRGGEWAVSNFPPEGGYANPDFQTFLGTLDYAVIKPRIEQALTLLKALGATSIGCVGFCWGGSIVTKVLSEGLVKAGAMAHPGFLNVDVMSAIQGPLCLCPSKDDGEMLDMKQAAEKSGNKVTYEYFGDMFHGFCAARGDFEDEANRTRANECIDIFVKFFNENL